MDLLLNTLSDFDGDHAASIGGNTEVRSIQSSGRFVSNASTCLMAIFVLPVRLEGSHVIEVL